MRHPADDTQTPTTRAMHSAITQAMGPLVSWPESQNPTPSYRTTLRAGSIKYGTPCSFGNLRNNNLKPPLAASQDRRFNSQGYLYRCGAREPRALQVAGTALLLHVLRPRPGRKAGAGGQGLLPAGLCPGRRGSQWECFSSAWGSLAQTSPSAF